MLESRKQVEMLNREFSFVLIRLGGIHVAREASCGTTGNSTSVNGAVYAVYDASDCYSPAHFELGAGW